MEGIGKFLKNALRFLLPPLLLIAAIEWYLAVYPSTFNLKAKYIRDKKAVTEVLVLGSSHNQMAVNPEWITSATMANLAFGGQDLALDSCLLERYLPEMPRLRYCLMEISYHSMEHANEAEYDRNNLYLRFHGINRFGRKSAIPDYSIFFSNPKRYIRFLNPFQRPTAVNRFGFATELSRFEQDLNRFEELGYDEKKIRATADNLLIQRHKYEDLDAYARNCRIVEHMIQSCIRRNVVPVVLIPPVFDTYYISMVPAKKLRRDVFLRQMTIRYPQLRVVNREHNPGYLVTDFKNDDHLSPQGARKFSGMLDTLIRNGFSNTDSALLIQNPESTGKLVTE